MNRNEIMQQMELGHKAAHSTFAPGEAVHLQYDEDNNAVIYDEEDNDITELFWNNPEFAEGWDVVGNENSNLKYDKQYVPTFEQFSERTHLNMELREGNIWTNNMRQISTMFDWVNSLINDKLLDDHMNLTTDDNHIILVLASYGMTGKDGGDPTKEDILKLIETVSDITDHYVKQLKPGGPFFN